MIHTDDQFSAAVEARIAALERRTDAEVVVVAAERSDAYADVSARAASVVSLLALAVILFIPHPIGPGWVLLDLVVVWLLTERVVRLRGITRALTSPARRAEAVRQAAEREFHAEAVHGTPNRSAVLVYVSALEGAVEVLPDLGVQGSVPAGELIAASDAFRHDDLAHFLAGLDALGEVLAAHLPHTEGSDAVDLPNAPVIRP